MTHRPDEDAPETTLIAAEIRALRKGRALRAGDIDRRVGPRLRELASGEVSDLRRVLGTQLGQHPRQLPDDLRTAVMASLGLSAETRHMPNFGDRVSRLAEQSGHNYRTALRRIDAAEQLLAEEIAGELRRRGRQAAATASGWYLDEFRTVLRLDTPTPESHEYRRIVATRAGLTEVMAWLDVPRNPDQPRIDLHAEVVYGGRLVRREEPSHSRVKFFVQLPAPLQSGQMHDYELILRVPEGRQIRPYYIFTPECHCNSFDLRVRFDPARLPAWIRRVEGETVRMYEEPRSDGNQLRPDGAGEVHLRFDNPTMYLGYGLQWQA
jgi:hypothetical protein